MARRMARYTLLIMTALFVVLCLLYMREASMKLHPFPSARDGAFVADAIARVFFSILFLTVIPYLIASVLMDLCRSWWRLVPGIGIWFYLFVFGPDLGTTGPHSDIDSYTLSLAVVPVLMFPVLVTAKCIWCLLEPRKPTGCCSKCGYDLRGSRGPACPECGTLTLVHPTQTEVKA